jgi:hypothetical protein
MEEVSTNLEYPMMLQRHEEMGKWREISLVLTVVQILEAIEANN